MEAQGICFSKIGADGAVLPADAPKWDAVIDCKTGLMWSVETKEVEKWSDAGAAASSMSSAGFNDWRLPTAEELLTLVDRTRVLPAISVDFFPGTPCRWFWSSTPYAGSPSDCAWVVYFNDGSANWSYHGLSGFVRAVRVGQ